MKEAEIVTLKKMDLDNPIMIEGLPGVGHVGKLVAEHLIEELDAEKIMEIYSHHFPPQVLVLDDGTVRMARNEVYGCKLKGTSDLLILVGDHQSSTTTGHYILTDLFLNIAEQYNVKRIYTLGGYGIGQMVETPTVIGAVNNPKLLKEMEKYGVDFKQNEPGGGIVGASGLILGMGEKRSIDAICLMGVTSGYIVDPRSAQSVMKVLCKALNIDVDMGPLEDRAKEMEKIVAHLRELEQISQQMPDVPPEDDMRYIR